MEKKEKRKSDNQLLWKYAGLTGQFIIVITFSMLLGRFLDKYFHFKSPTLIWTLPLLFIITSIIKIVKDTSRKQ